MAYAYVLGTYGVTRGGSSPLLGTMKIKLFPQSQTHLKRKSIL